MATGQSLNEMSTYVFLHLNTTCLPERDQPCRITEICLMAVNQNSLNNNQNSPDEMPRVLQKLVFCLNPGNDIQEEARQISLLKNEDLADCTSFSEITASLKSFLHNLTKPVCLIAHNGDIFDFAVLKAELAKADKPSLIRHFYCADSLEALRDIDRRAMETTNREIFESISSKKRKSSYGDTTSKPMLKKSKTTPTMQTKKQTSSMERSQSIPISFSAPPSYKLREYYKEMFKSEPDQSYSAEGFCTALIKVAQAKPGFFEWVNKHAKKFEEIMPADIN